MYVLESVFSVCKIHGDGGKVKMNETVEPQESRGQREDFFSRAELWINSICHPAAPSLKGETVLPSCEICVA